MVDNVVVRLSIGEMVGHHTEQNHVVGYKRIYGNELNVLALRFDSIVVVRE